MKRMEWPSLTDAQKDFATKHHNLIYLFLHQRGLSIDEWYDIVAIAYLKSIIRYDPQLGAFSNFAYYKMNYAVALERKYQYRPCRSAIKVSFEEMLEIDKEPCTTDDLTGAFANELLQRLTDRERCICKLTIAGHSQSKIAKLIKTPRTTFRREFSRIQQKVKEALAE